MVLELFTNSLRGVLIPAAQFALLAVLLAPPFGGSVGESPHDPGTEKSPETRSRRLPKTMG